MLQIASEAGDKTEPAAIVAQEKRKPASTPAMSKKQKLASADAFFVIKAGV